MAVDREKVQEAARKYAEKGRYDKAIVEYQRIIAEEPNDARTLLKIGDLQVKMEAYQAAIDTYERVGKTYVQQGFAKKAIAVYLQIRDILIKNVPQLEERYGHVLPKLAELYEQCGLVSDALPAYDEIASKHLKAGREKEAIAAFEKLVQLDPQNPLVHLRLGEALARMKDVAGAMAKFSVATDLLVKLGRRDDALKVLERQLQIHSEPTVAKRAARMLLERRSQNDGMLALAKLQICFQANPKEFETLALLALAFEQIGQRPKALEVKKEIARIARDNGDEATFKGMLVELQKEAPDDEVVQQLIQQGMNKPGRTGEHPVARGAMGSTHSTGQTRGGQTQAKQAAQPQPTAQQQQSKPAAQQPAGQPANTAARAVQPPAQQPAPAPAVAAPVRARPVEPEPEAEVSIEEIDAEYIEDLEDLDVELMSESGIKSGPVSSDGVAIPSQLEIAEELSEQASFDADAYTHRTITEAIAYRQARLYAKALETLGIGLEVLPASIPLREQLRDTLLEVGDREGAVGEMITLAAIAMDSGDLQRSAELLYTVLQLAPGHMRAKEMLYDMGYPDPESELDAIPAEPGEPTDFETYDNRHPLPSYDLEGVGPGRGFASTGGMQSRGPDLLEADDPFEATTSPKSLRGVEIPAASLDTDDPFESGMYASATEVHENTVLGVAPPAAPSLTEPFPLETAPQVRGVTDAAPPPDFDLPVDELDDLPTAEPHFSKPPASMSPGPLAAVAEMRGFQGGDSIEDSLEEIDFFAQRGLLDDARSIIEEQLQRFPNHPLLLDKLRELEELTAEPATDDIDHNQQVHSLHMPHSAEPEIDDLLDLDSDEDVNFEPTPEANDKMANEQVDVEAVFEMFKAGVKAQISESDSQTHYDLGLAYRDMNLLNDAIQEFTIASRDPKRECVCLCMIGMIESERGRLDAAIESLKAALAAKERTVEEETSIYYELGDLFERKKNNPAALDSFQKCARRDAAFRDVADRIKRLEPPPKAKPKVAALDEDFDSVLDDLFESPKRLVLSTER